VKLFVSPRHAYNKSMKITFDPPSNQKKHTYCLNCHVEQVKETTVGGIGMFHCNNCDQTNGRALIIDPAIRWWIDDTKEYWHESVGVFIRDPKGKFLFFDRTKHPLGLTVPAGHVDVNEPPETAAPRELREETGIETDQVDHVLTTDITGDSCRRGADIHRWHCFIAHVPEHTEATINDEGTRPIWLTLGQALERELTPAVRYLLLNHQTQLEKA
jgi:8-oxo-dGTP pyrophosphatase MutT (NUDIX family)